MPIKTRKRANRVRPTRARAFEKLVAQVEAALASKGVTVRSPDRIQDVRSGKGREVDASLRYKIGSANILVTIECRDRSRVQDVTWIEQLHSKQQAIGAAKTIAVSSRPFSETAARTAAVLGIETRVLSEITESDVVQWAASTEVTIHDVAVSDMAVFLETWTGDQIAGPASEWLARVIAADAFEARFLWLSPGAEAQSPLSVLRSRAAFRARIPDSDSGWVEVTLAPKAEVDIGDPGYEPFMRGVPDSGEPIAKDIAVEFDRGAAFVRWGTAEWEIHRVVLRGTVRRIGSRLAPTKTLRYESPEGAVADVSERTMDVGRGEQLVMSSVRPVRGRTNGDDTA